MLHAHAKSLSLEALSQTIFRYSGATINPSERLQINQALLQVNCDLAELDTALGHIGSMEPVLLSKRLKFQVFSDVHTSLTCSIRLILTEIREEVFAVTYDHRESKYVISLIAVTITATIKTNHTNLRLWHDSNSRHSKHRRYPGEQIMLHNHPSRSL